MASGTAFVQLMTQPLAVVVREVTTGAAGVSSKFGVVVSEVDEDVVVVVGAGRVVVVGPVVVVTALVLVDAEVVVALTELDKGDDPPEQPAVAMDRAIPTIKVPLRQTTSSRLFTGAQARRDDLCPNKANVSTLSQTPGPWRKEADSGKVANRPSWT